MLINGAPGDLCDERTEAEREGERERVMFKGVKREQGVTVHELGHVHANADKCQNTSDSVSFWP